MPNLKKTYQFDSVNNGHICSAMTANATVQGTKEPYLNASNPKGACYGIVTDVFSPPSSAISSLLAPLQKPYVIQSIIEQQLSSQISALPVWVSATCHLAIRKYFCGS